MSIPGAANPLLLATAAAAGGYSISRSLRFNSADSAYLSRTPASAGNRKTWTWAGWVKRSGLGVRYGLFNAFAASPLDSTALEFDSNNKLWFYNYTTGFNFQLVTTPVYRDPSAWLHICLAVDVTQSTASNRVKLYVNGTQVTAFDTASYPANQDWNVNSTNTHYIGGGYDSQYYASLYLADCFLIDGQALDPTSFGEFSATTGVWMPKAYAGTYGTNGFKLNFSDNSTAAALGTDTSGQGNTWTVNNLSVTAGAGNDSLIDVPVNGSEVDTGAGGQVRGNYCTLNPLDKASAVALANGNLEATITTADHMGRATIAIPSSDKWYFEFSPTVIFGTRSPSVGVASGSLSTTASNGYKDALAWTLSCASGNKQNSGAETSYGSAFSANDIGMCAVDVANGKIWWGRNGTWIASGDPAAGTNAAFTNVSGTVFPAVFGPDGSVNCTCVFNFGARSFAYTAPSGFKALCTANLPAPVVTKPSTVMDVLTWSGSGGARSFTGLGFSPDLVWGKQRNGSNAHQIYDIVRGAGNNKDLASDYTAAEGSGTTGASAYGYLSSFDSTGFSVANGTDGTFGAGYWNLSGRTYAAWTWDAGSSTVTNTQGSISSQVRANASAGFSVVTFSMLSGTYTVGHGLNVAPSLLITKGRTFTSNWWVYHASLGSSQYLGLNSTAAASSLSWGGSPTSSVFTANNNFFSNGQDYVVYAFAPVAGYSSMSTWTGNGSSDGPMVWTGFRPRWLLFKETGGTGSWGLIDSARSTYNVTSHELYANLSDAEYAVSSFDFLSNGFKLRTSSTAYNGSGKTFIFAAFAESPFQYARAR